MNFKTQTAEELRTRSARITSKSALVGLDGFVDEIVTPIGLRTGRGASFTAISTIEEFSRRIAGAAGKSTNIELFPRMEKLGGNGPIMAHSLMAIGTRMKFIGSLGSPAVHPVFKEFAAEASAVSLCEPGRTTALEFDDGKIMFGRMTSLDEITFPTIIRAAGEGAFLTNVAEADLIALVNWTMIPNMTSIFAAFTETVLPQIPPKERIFFFDLADPEKRSDGDLTGALRAISRFQPFGRVTLGLNLKEAQHVHRILGFPVEPEDEKGLQTMARKIRQQLQISTVVIHPRESAACSTKEDSYWIPGPYTPKPQLTTGAGDHFNAGFVAGQLLGLSPRGCLAVAVCCSGSYVRTGRSPTLSEIENFLHTWE